MPTKLTKIGVQNSLKNIRTLLHDNPRAASPENLLEALQSTLRLLQDVYVRLGMIKESDTL